MMVSKELTARVVGPDKLTQTEIAAWNRICQDSPAYSSPFYSFDFIASVALAHPGVRVCAIARNRRPVAFLPFQYASAMHRLFRAAEPAGEHMSDYFGLIAEPELRLSSHQLLRLAGLSHLSFTHLDETQLGFGLEAEQPETGMRIVMPEGSAAFLALARKKDNKYFAETARRERQMAAEFGPIHFVMNEPYSEETLARLIGYKRQQYARTGVRDALAEPWTRKLLDVLYRRSSGCRAVLSTLHAGDTWVASHLGLRSGGILHYWFPVYNPELQRFGPGKLLLNHIIEAADQDGFAELDHGAGDSFYKRELSNNSHLYYRGVWSRSDLPALAYRAACSLRWRMEAASAAKQPGPV